MEELAHSALGASSADRWMTCPGSVPLSAGLPDDESPHARKGSAAHALAEHCLLNGEDAFEYLGETHPISEYADVEVCPDMTEAVQVYIDHIRSYGRKIDRKMLEARVSLEPLGDWARGMFGTADAIHYNAKTRTLHVDDYKHGEGVVVDAQTPQTKYYGIGGLLKQAVLAKAKKVVCTIIQPRAYHEDGPIRQAVFTIDELNAWVDEQLKPAVLRVQQAEIEYEEGAPDWADRHLVPSEKGCKFCRAKGTCPKRAQQALEQAGLEFGEDGAVRPQVPMAKLTDEQVARILDNEAAIRDWLSGVAALATEQLKRGQDITGGRYKLVKGRSSRDWADEDKAREALHGLGFGDEHLFTQKFTTPAQAEKLVGKAQKNALADLIVTTEGKPTLAPADDKRPAISAGPESDFTTG